MEIVNLVLELPVTCSSLGSCWGAHMNAKASNTLRFSARRAEYKAYADVKPTRMIRAKSQYLPPDEKTRLETSYSATFKAQAPVQPADNKALDRRRVRSLYMDPSKQVRFILI